MKFGNRLTGPVEGVNIPRYLFNAMEKQIEEQEVEINLLKASLQSANRKRLETEARHEKAEKAAAEHIKGLREEFNALYKEAANAKRNHDVAAAEALRYKATAKELTERLASIRRITVPQTAGTEANKTTINGSNWGHF